MKRRNWMGYAKERVEGGSSLGSKFVQGLRKKIAQRARIAATEAREAKKRAKAKEDEAHQYFKELKATHSKGYRWPGTKREKSGQSSGRTLSDLLYGRNPKMAKKKRRTKRKKAMPAGLKKYWAKKRAQKRARSRNARIPRKVRKASLSLLRRAVPAAERLSRKTRRQAYALLKRSTSQNRVRNYRKRTTTRRRRNSAPRIPSRVSRITLPAMSPTATRKVVSIIRRMSGNRRVRVK